MARPGQYSRGSKLSEYIKKKPKKRKPTAWNLFTMEKDQLVKANKG